jgi:hypothetical protein
MFHYTFCILEKLLGIVSKLSLAHTNCVNKLPSITKKQLCKEIVTFISPTRPLSTTLVITNSWDASSNTLSPLERAGIGRQVSVQLLIANTLLYTTDGLNICGILSGKL